MKERYFTISGLPDFVDITKYKDMAFGHVRVDYPYTFTLGELAEALKKLSDLGFEYESITHELGYYDSVDNKTIELTHKNVKSLNLSPKN